MEVFLIKLIFIRKTLQWRLTLHSNPSERQIVSQSIEATNPLEIFDFVILQNKVSKARNCFSFYRKLLTELSVLMYNIIYNLMFSRTRKRRPWRRRISWLTGRRNAKQRPPLRQPPRSPSRPRTSPATATSCSSARRRATTTTTRSAWASDQSSRSASTGSRYRATITTSAPPPQKSVKSAP